MQPPGGVMGPDGTIIPDAGTDDGSSIGAIPPGIGIGPSGIGPIGGDVSGGLFPSPSPKPRGKPKPNCPRDAGKVCGTGCRSLCKGGQLCKKDADCSSGLCRPYPRAFRGLGADELRCMCRGGLFLSIEHPAQRGNGTATNPCLSQVEMCTNGKWDAFEGAVDCGFFCPNKCAAGQSCRGHDGCATRHCNPLTRTCGCPSPLLPSSSGTACERVLSAQTVKPVSCGRVSCRCPSGARPAPDGVNCVREQREIVLLPAETATDLCFNDRRDQDETDRDCGGRTCMRRCGSGQLCKRASDCATGLSCRSVTVGRSANGTAVEESRCSCPEGRFLSFKRAVPSCVRVQELCNNGQWDPANETGVDCGGVCAAQAGSLCGVGKNCLSALDCDSKTCDPQSRKCVCAPGLTPQGPFCKAPAALPPVVAPPTTPATPTGPAVPGGLPVAVTPLPAGGVRPPAPYIVPLPGPVGISPGLVPGVSPTPGVPPPGVPPGTPGVPPVVTSPRP